MRAKELPRKVGRWVAIRQIQAMWLRTSGTAPSLRTLRHWCQNGRLPASKRNGGDWRIDLRALAASPANDQRELYEDLVCAVEAGTR